MSWKNDKPRKSELEASRESKETRTKHEVEARVKTESWKLVGEAYVHAVVYSEIDAEALGGLNVPVQMIQIIWG